ncbi:hypothetical protein ANME2D_01957 [Candidatus Methanoperedens nitroreducens]|uniref:Uncharacterized protein n=1 Tax=Candidatus Methanoperedens nitratireducens TaxID=1392998 RepID=A0A062UY73_9EURY|nr:FAD-dependent oxidoreductase [Candidatus Methanoperedens nitroreducens]KCZ71901.1 hypothetical protein ANME2D_01957 [Candidatus Methanoperedens nitroreducens]MDJ1422126.1 FAD-dependent oxidoreductase [Candidatus Methanoperedens sp.]
MAEKFDVIIVGAGPGGCAAAYSLAKMGFNVLILERGKYPGAKNVMGGRMYAHALNRLIPGFWKEALVCTDREVRRRNPQQYPQSLLSIIGLLFGSEGFSKGQTLSPKFLCQL